MSSVPPDTRGASSGMRATFQNGASLVSIGFFFSIVVAGLAATLPSTLSTGLTRNGVPAAAANQIAHLPPTAALFGAFLGYNPIQQLLPPTVLQALSASDRATLLGQSFFPQLISAPFMDGLHLVFYVSAAMCLIAAAASLLRGKQVIYPQGMPQDTLDSGAIASNGGATGAVGPTTILEPVNNEGVAGAQAPSANHNGHAVKSSGESTADLNSIPHPVS